MNKTTQNYFISLFKRKKRILALYTFIVFMAYPFLLISDILTNKANNIIEITEVIFVLCLLVLGLLAIVLPLFTFKFSFVKKNVDTYFALPLNRNHIFKAHFIAPIIGTILPITISYLIGGCFLIPDSGLEAYIGLFLLLILAFLLFIVIYSMNTFFILKCNNIIDASLISGAIGIVPLMLYGASYTFLNSQVVRNGMLDVIVSKIPQIIIDLLSPYRGFLLLTDTISTGFTIKVSFGSFDYVLYFYYLVIGIIFMIQAKNSFKTKKGEDAEQLTTHYLTYPLLSNLGLISLILYFNFTEFDLTAAILIMTILFVIYMIINGIAHRSFKINMKMIVKFIVLFAVVNGFNIISKETEFFGINRSVIDYTNYEEVSFDLHLYDYDQLISTGYHVEIDSKKELSKEEQELFEYIKLLQKEKSLAFKEDDYDTLYPNDGIGDYNLNIYYDYIANSGDFNTNDEYAYYQLSYEHAQKIIEIMNKIESTKSYQDTIE